MGKSKENEFLNLLDQHSGILYKVSRIYACSVADEEDLRQEIIFQAWRSFSSFKGEAKFSTWLYRLALNTALTHIRKDRPRASDYALEEAQDTVTNDSRELIIAHIRKFSDADKLIIMLHLDGYSNEEVARISGIKKNHLAVKLYRIKMQLSKELKANEP